MKFAPKTSEEIKQNERPVWPANTYDFEIKNGADKVSKKGNNMIELRVRVFNESADEILVFDYLMESMAFKLRHCCEAIGILEKYESGDLVAGDFEGGTGKLKLVVQPASKDKDTGKEYPERNGIADYIPRDTRTKEEKEKTAKNHGMSIGDTLNDEIPTW